MCLNKHNAYAKIRKMKATRWALVALALIPFIVLVGWSIGNIYLTQVMPDFTPMNPVTASCFLLIAGALAARASTLRRAFTYSKIVGLIVLVVGALMLCKYVLGIDAKIDQVFFSSHLHGNRIAPNTAFNLTVIGLALLLQKARRVVWAIVGVTAFISMLSVIGYVYGLRQLFGITGLNPMAVHTAICFLLVDAIMAGMLVGRRRLYVDKKIIASLAFALAIVVGASTVAAITMKDSAKTEEHIDRTHMMIGAADNLRTSLVDAETGQRGYLLTGKSSYLEPYTRGTDNIDENIERLRDLLIQDKKSTETIDAIKSLAKQKLAIMATTISLKRAGKSAQALEVVSSDKGKLYLDAIRGKLNAIQSEQIGELARLNDEARSARQNALWILAIATAIDATLILSAFLLIQRSIKERATAEERLSETLRSLRIEKAKDEVLLGSIGDAVFAIDVNRRIQLFNAAAEQISGFLGREVLGRPYDEVLKFEREKTGKPNHRFIGEALSGKQAAMSNHTVLIRKDGKRVSVADSAAPIQARGGQIEGAIIVFRDVSKNYELDKAKSEFVSLASHQLRTPLSAINWYGEMLLSGDAGKLNKTQHEYIKEIFQGNQRMIDLVNSLLDVSRLEVGKLPDKPAPTDLSALIGSLEKELAAEVASKQLKFTKQLSTMPLVVADPKQLRMIVQNLLSNAVKYTPAKGSVTVRLRKATAADLAAAKLRGTDPHLFFSVQDTGYGIPTEQQPNIFGKLFRADNVRKLDVEGTGLGLYIVREVVEKLGGRVWFESIESVGTTFYIVLPLRSRKAK